MAHPHLLFIDEKRLGFWFYKEYKKGCATIYSCAWSKCSLKGLMQKGVFNWKVIYFYKLLVFNPFMYNCETFNRTITVNDESLEWLKFGESGSQTFWWIKVWRIHHEINKTSRGLIVGWRMKVWQILSICQIRQTLATPNFHCLQ